LPKLEEISDFLKKKIIATGIIGCLLCFSFKLLKKRQHDHPCGHSTAIFCHTKSQNTAQHAYKKRVTPLFKQKIA
jgi:hypothetical protein